MLKPMFREMRRNSQQLPQEEVLKILEEGSFGVLALLGDQGYPYGVPVSFVYQDEKIYFHSAVTGHKIDALRGNSKASFCVVSQDVVVPEKYTTMFRSVVAFGRIREITDEEEKRQVLTVLGKKYHPLDTESHRMEVVDRALERVCMLEFQIEHLTGKEGGELAKIRREAP